MDTGFTSLFPCVTSHFLSCGGADRATTIRSLVRQSSLHVVSNTVRVLLVTVIVVVLLLLKHTMARRYRHRKRHTHRHVHAQIRPLD